MRLTQHPLTFVFALALALVAVTLSGGPAAAQTGPQAAAPAPDIGRLPFAFVRNDGQWPDEVQFRADCGRMAVWLHARGWTFVLSRRSTDGDTARVRGAAVRMTFEGAGAGSGFVGEAPRPGRRHYLLGADRAAWRTDVPAFARLSHRDLHDGIDLVAREGDGFFEYDLLLRPGADPERVVVRCEGMTRMRFEPDGAVVLETPAGEVRQAPPRTWEITEAGERRALTCRFEPRGEGRFGFRVEGRRRDRPLVIDPGLTFSSYMGANGADGASGVAVDPTTGAVTVAGTTDSTNFPTSPGAFQRTFVGSMGVGDGFVIRLDRTGTKVVYATYLGGSGSDQARGLSVDKAGVATIVGWTASGDFPVTTGVVQAKAGGLGDGFVTRLSADGSKLIYSTYLGGTKTDQANAVAVDSSGVATVTGYAISTDFPITPNALQKKQKGNYNVFVTRLNATATSLIFSTYLGGTKYDIGRAVHVDVTGLIAIGGQTGSPDFPVTPGAFQTKYVGPTGFGTDAFVALLDRTGSRLLYATFLGGSGFDSVGAVHLDATGAVTAAGYTLSANFPVSTGAYQRTYGGGTQFRGDAFVTRLGPAGSQLLYSTFLGGAGPDDALGLSVDAAGVATVVGAGGTGFPVTPGAYQTTFGGIPTVGSDGFLARLDPTGSRLDYATYLGGNQTDSLAAVALDGNEEAVVAGMTNSTNFPTTSTAPQRQLAGRSAAVVTRFDMLPKGTRRYGVSTAACAGNIVIGAAPMPASPEPAFAFTCVNAPPLTAGWLLLALGRVPAGYKVLGVTLYPDPGRPHIILAAATNGAGYARTPVPIPSGLRGVVFHCQFLWVNTPGCGGAGKHSASNAIEVTVQ